MILPREALADAVLHQPRKAGQHTDWRIDALAVKRTVEDYLPLGDIARKVGHGVGNIVVGHGEDRYLSDRALAALYHARPLIERGKGGVKVARVALPARDLALGGAEFTQRLAVGRHIRHNDEDMHILLKRQIFRSR